ncbi:hypothetical protein NQ315_016914, partial [Exocentrus adspersus]
NNFLLNIHESCVDKNSNCFQKSWQQKHGLLFKASKFGIQRLELYDVTDSKDPRIITLENCIKVHAKSGTIFCVTTKTAVHEFATLTEQSLTDWLSAIQSVAFPDEDPADADVQEDNDLYCSTGDIKFIVKVEQSAASLRCGLENKNYNLVLTSTALQLRNIPDNNLLYTWPYCFIRRYGYKSGKFTFEAGRKCESGEGTFFLEHPNQQEIFRCIASKMKSMKKLLSGESMPLLDCGELQLQAALSMEAGSRSPLPPSPMFPPVQESNLCSVSLPNVLDLDHSLKRTKLVKPPVLPRKSVDCLAPSNDCTYETVGKYDDVEYRSDAWRKFGIDNPDHTEQINESDQQDDYMSWGHVKKEIEHIKPPVQPLAPAIIAQSSVTDLDEMYYDKLDFFGSTSKLNLKSGYKQVLPPITAVSYHPSFNEYDEVQCPDIESVRPADDSHLGYAVITKIPGKDALKEVENDDKKKEVVLTQRVEEQYAVVTKKRGKDGSKDKANIDDKETFAVIAAKRK